MDLKVKDTRELYQSRVFTLCEDILEFPDGHQSQFSYLKHPGACVMIPLMDDDTVLLIKQYRHAIGRYIWEFPAGTINGGEAPLACAHRELIEETGFSAAKMEDWGEIYPIPSYSTESIHVFKATELSPAAQNLDEDEILSVHKVTIRRALEMAQTGGIIDSKTLACLLLLKLHS